MFTSQAEMGIAWFPPSNNLILIVSEVPQQLIDSWRPELRVQSVESMGFDDRRPMTSEGVRFH